MEQKRHSISLYLNPEEKTIVEAVSKEVSLSSSAFCRSAAIRAAKNLLKEEERSH